MRWMGKSVGCAVLIIVMSLPRLLLAAPPAFGQVTIPRVSTPPRLEDFLHMKPTPAWDGQMANSERFIQRTPRGRLLTGAAFRHLGLAEPQRDVGQFGLFGDTDSET